MYSTGERVAALFAGQLRIYELFGGGEIADAVVEMSTVHQAVVANRDRLVWPLAGQVNGVQVRAVRLGEPRVVGQSQVGAVMRLCTGGRLVAGCRIIAAARAAVAIRTVRVRTFDQIQAAVLIAMHSSMIFLVT